MNNSICIFNIGTSENQDWCIAAAITPASETMKLTKPQR